MDTIELLKQGKAGTLAGSDYILTEFPPDEEWAYIRNCLYDLLCEGYRPIVAHTERYRNVVKDFNRVEELKDMGCRIQINAGELPGLLGGQLKRTARQPDKRRACRSYRNGRPQSRGRTVCIDGGRGLMAAKTLQPGICGTSALQKRSTHSGQYRYGRHRIEKGERDMENQNQRSNEETEIDLAELFWVLWRKLPLMIAVGLFTALLVFGGSKFLVTPTYQSVTKIYILNKQDSSNTNVTYSDLQAGTQLVKDYAGADQKPFRTGSGNRAAGSAH